MRGTRCDRVPLRREGLYSSHLGNWRKSPAQGQLGGLQGQRRGCEPGAGAGAGEEVERLRRERARLGQAEAIIEVQGKLSQLLEATPEKDEGR